MKIYGSSTTHLEYGDDSNMKPIDKASSKVIGAALILANTMIEINLARRTARNGEEYGVLATKSLLEMVHAVRALYPDAKDLEKDVFAVSGELGFEIQKHILSPEAHA